MNFVPFRLYIFPAVNLEKVKWLFNNIWSLLILFLWPKICLRPNKKRTKNRSLLEKGDKSLRKGDNHQNYILNNALNFPALNLSKPPTLWENILLCCRRRHRSCLLSAYPRVNARKQKAEESMRPNVNGYIVLISIYERLTNRYLVVVSRLTASRVIKQLG